MMDSRSRYYNSPKYSEAREASKQRAMDRIADYEVAQPFFVWVVEVNEEIRELGSDLHNAYLLVPNLVGYLDTMWKQAVPPERAASFVLEAVDKHA